VGQVHHRSIISATSAGSKSAELRYKSWGETRYTDGTTPTPYRFTGQREEATIGLYFYNARYYDPALGRFVQADTLVPDPGNPQALNRYAYVTNNPLRYTDPTGHFTQEQIEQYLKERYKDKWGSYLSAWQWDKVFWEMLLLADYGDVLYAPTTSLTSGSFIQIGSTFGFVGQYGLHEYQGHGPYSLTNAQGFYKLNFSTAISVHPADTGSPRYETWEQPLYRYTENGPVYSGYNRRVAYQRLPGLSGWSVDLFAGDSMPWIIGGPLLPYLAKKFGIGVVCPACGPLLGLASAATAANNALWLHYQFRVDMVDKRTFLCPAGGCDSPPVHTSRDLWR